jgi:hypothetical protein
MTVWQFLPQMLKLYADQQSVLWKLDKFSIFLNLSHGLSLNTVTNALTRELQSVNKRMNIQCFQLKFFQYSRHKLILFFNFLMFPFFYSPPVFPVWTQKKKSKRLLCIKVYTLGCVHRWSLAARYSVHESEQCFRMNQKRPERSTH